MRARRCQNAPLSAGSQPRCDHLVVSSSSIAEQSGALVVTGASLQRTYRVLFQRSALTFTRSRHRHEPAAGLPVCTVQGGLDGVPTAVRTPAATRDAAPPTCTWWWTSRFSGVKLALCDAKRPVRSKDTGGCGEARRCLVDIISVSACEVLGRAKRSWKGCSRCVELVASRCGVQKPVEDKSRRMGVGSSRCSARVVGGE